MSCLAQQDFGIGVEAAFKYSASALTWFMLFCYKIATQFGQKGQNKLAECRLRVWNLLIQIMDDSHTVSIISIISVF